MARLIGRKTPMMREIEERYGIPLDKLLIERYNARGLPAMAAELGVSKGTLWSWFTRYGIEIKREAVAVER